MRLLLWWMESCLTFLACRVQDDIARILRMTPDRLLKFVHPFNRPNLFYEVCCAIEPIYHEIHNRFVS